MQSPKPEPEQEKLGEEEEQMKAGCNGIVGMDLKNLKTVLKAEKPCMPDGQRCLLEIEQKSIKNFISLIWFFISLIWNLTNAWNNRRPGKQHGLTNNFPLTCHFLAQLQNQNYSFEEEVWNVEQDGEFCLLCKGLTLLYHLAREMYQTLKEQTKSDQSPG